MDQCAVPGTVPSITAVTAASVVFVIVSGRFDGVAPLATPSLAPLAGETGESLVSVAGEIVVPLALLAGEAVAPTPLDSWPCPSDRHARASPFASHFYRTLKARR